MFLVCGALQVFWVLYLQAFIMNSKSKEYSLTMTSFSLYYAREYLLTPAVSKKKKKQMLAVLQKEEREHEDEKRLSILSNINYEATFYGVWTVNLMCLGSFLFMSFVVLRFWSIRW